MCGNFPDSMGILSSIVGHAVTATGLVFGSCILECARLLVDSSRDGHEVPVQQFVVVRLSAQQVFSLFKAPPPPVGTYSEASPERGRAGKPSGCSLEKGGFLKHQTPV